MNRLVVLVVLSVCCLCAFQFVLLLWNRDAAEPPLPRFAVPSRAWSTRPRPPRPVLNSRSRPRASQPLAISLMIASDMDKESRVNGSGKATWATDVWEGVLIHEPRADRYNISWTKKVQLKARFAEGGRGMEISELIHFGGALLGFDDHTGIIYSIFSNVAIPKYILPAGSGLVSQGFKSEWATTKEGVLYVGSTGKEFEKDGKVLHHRRQYVKRISQSGTVSEDDWTSNYDAMRRAVGALQPGYIVHEAAMWYKPTSQWLFLPRKISTSAYNSSTDDPHVSGSSLIVANLDFSSVHVVQVGPTVPGRGFSTVKLLPGKPPRLVAIKTEEVSDTYRSYLTIVDLEGGVLLNDTLISSTIKFEGIELGRLKTLQNGLAAF